MAKRGWRKHDEVEKGTVNRKSLKKLYAIFGYVRPYLSYFITGLLFLLLSSVTLLAFPFLIGKLIDVATGKETWILTSINTIAILLILILLVQGIFSFFRVYLFAITSEKAVAGIRKKEIHLPQVHHAGIIQERENLLAALQLMYLFCMIHFLSHWLNYFVNCLHCS